MILAFMTFSPIFNCCNIFMLRFLIIIFYSHLKVASERSKRRDLLACIFITKSISKKLLIKKYQNVYLKKKIGRKY